MKAKVVAFPAGRVRPTRPYVKAYCQYAMTFPPTARVLIKQAVKDNAPATAVFKDRGHWVLFEDLDLEAQLCIQDLMALMPGGSNAKK